MTNAKRTRVVFVVNDFLVGGMQRQFVEQSKRYDREHLEIVLITLFSFPGAQTFYEELQKDVAVHRLSFSGFSDIRSWIQLHRLLKTLAPDVVVSSLFFANVVTRVLSFFHDYASLAREHNTYFNKKWWQRTLDRVLASRSYAVVAVSKTVADFTAADERINREKFRVIYNGIDLEAAQRVLETLPPQERLKEDMGISPLDKVLLNVSRLMPQKNHDLLIRGFARFRVRHPEYCLVLVGDGPLGDELRRVAEEEGIADAVLFLGYREDVWDFYKMADAYVSASSMEGLSNSMLEAFAAGLPIVSTKTAGTDELIVEGENGFFAESSVCDLCGAIERLHEADSITLSRNARATAARFDLHSTVVSYQELFLEAAASLH